MTAHHNNRGILPASQLRLCRMAFACSVALGAKLALAQAPPPPADPAAPPPPPAAEAPPPPPAEPAAAPTMSAEATAMPMADPSAQVTPQVEPAAAPRQVGGHVGIATPFVTFGSDDTTTISDQFTLLHPIGIGVKVSDSVVVDFEMVVSNAIDPDGPTGLLIDPGVVFNTGPVALGLRLAFPIGANPASVGLIPLVNKGLVDLGNATWFIEAAFPTFYQGGDVNMSIVGHTGIGF